MIALPLPRDMHRCIGLGFRPGETCVRKDTCARHVTRRHDLVAAQAAYRCCPTDFCSLYVPLDGFPPKDEEESPR